jgi:hypothetical protein
LPNIDRGWIVVDVKELLTLDISLRKEVVKVALSLRNALLITSPSIIYVSFGYFSIPLVLGVGSLAFPPEDERRVRDLGVNLYVVSRREWVDGCWIKGGSIFGFLDKGEEVEVDGIFQALTLSDPVALLLNGIKGAHKVVVGLREQEDLIPIVRVNNMNVVFKSVKGGYFSTVVEGEAREILEYIMPLAASCMRPSQ